MTDPESVGARARGPSQRAQGIAPSLIRRLFDARRPTSMNLGLGEPGMPIPIELLDAGVARYRETRPGYTLNIGLPELRERIAAHYALPHAAKADNVIVTVGLQEGLFSTLLAITDPGDEVLISDPAFPAYRTVGELLGLQVTAVPSERERGFELDVARIVAAIGPRTRAIILNSPSNPTGRIDSPELLAALVEVTERAGIWLISDEVYAELYFDGKPPTSIGRLCDRAIVLGALSKCCSMTGFRLGYVLAPDLLAAAIAKVHQFNVTCAPTISQLLALEVFENPAWLGATREQFGRQRKAMLRAVDRDLGLPYVPPDGGFFLFVDARAVSPDSLALAEELLAEADVVTVPGVGFGPNGEGYLRLSYGGSEETIVEGIARIGRHLEARRKK